MNIWLQRDWRSWCQNGRICPWFESHNAQGFGVSDGLTQAGTKTMKMKFFIFFSFSFRFPFLPILIRNIFILRDLRKLIFKYTLSSLHCVCVCVSFFHFRTRKVIRKKRTKVRRVRSMARKTTTGLRATDSHHKTVSTMTKGSSESLRSFCFSTARETEKKRQKTRRKKRKCYE